jgi:hypothetical protein
MIKSIIQKTDEPGVTEQSLGYGEVGGNAIEAHMVLVDLDPADQTIYNDFYGLFTTNCFGEIANTVDEIDIDRITTNVIVEGTDELDYSVMVAGDQAKVDAFVSMINRLNTLPV